MQLGIRRPLVYTSSSLGYVATVIADGAVGFWELAEPSGATAVDQIGNSNGTYTPNGGSLVLGQGGIPGGGGATSTFFASNAYVAIPDASPQSIGSGSFTLEGWVFRTSTGAFEDIVSGVASNAIALRFNNDDTLCGFNRGVSVIVQTTTTFTDTTVFHHIVWTWDGATNHIYMDAIDQPVTVINPIVGSAPNGWRIAVDDNGGSPTHGISARVGMIAIYPVALSSSQVANHYTIGNTP